MAEQSQNPIAKSYLLPIIGIIGVDFKYTDLLMHLNAAKDCSILDCVYDSLGGYIDEGLKITEALSKCGKIIKSRNSGNVASIAVSPFLVASKENRKFDPNKGQFLIHCPLIDPEDMKGDMYTADDLTSMAKALKTYEGQLVKQYVVATGSDANILKAFMDENKPLTPEQITSLGFAQIEQPQFKAVALINNKSEKMEVKEVHEKLSVIETLLVSFKNMFKAKNIVLQCVDGKEIDFGDAVQTPEQIVVGVKGTVDGKPAQGEYTFADGSKMNFDKGELKGVVPAQNPEMDKLQKENQDLQNKLKESTEAQNKMKVELEAIKTASNKITEEFTAFKNQFSKENPTPNTPVVDVVKKKNLTRQELEKLI